VVQVPQRIQTLNNLSPLQAGFRLLPLVLTLPLGSFLASIFSKKSSISPVLILLGAAALQVLGASLMSILPSTGSIMGAQYVYEIILGLGLGISISTLFLIVPDNIERKYQGLSKASFMLCL
jgi:hypothetical protein